MKDEKTTTEDYMLASYGTLAGLAMTIANAIICDGTWQTIWIVVAVISVICYILAWVLNCTVKDGFGQLLMYMVYSFVMFFAGCGTALFTWGGDSWILILTFPFAMVGLALAPFAVIGIIFATVAGMSNYYEEVYKPRLNRKKAVAL